MQGLCNAGKLRSKALILAREPAGRLIGPIFEPPLVHAAYASKVVESRGRLYSEPEGATRTCFQRDRDRIIHAAAFRRLKHKTQVFVQHEGDYYRTRLTHSLEVAQVARSVARVLALDEDLAEAVALAHDLGHTPFGHAGEEALNEATKSIGGFDHNAHALRLVTQLEHRYAAFDGLNLTWETLEGLVKHNGPLTGAVLEPIAAFDAAWPLELSTWPGLEAQIAALSDDIAYINHDIDDGLRAGLFTMADLSTAPFAGPHVTAVIDRFGELELGRLIGEIVRRLMSAMISDLLAETTRRLDKARPPSAGAVRSHGGPLAGFSPGMAENIASLKAYLFENMYRHPQVMGPMNDAKRVVSELFGVLSRHPERLPGDWARACGAPGDARTAGVVRDYIAGMTDRFALEEHRRIAHTEIPRETV
jgi:dGTPase